MFSAEEADPPLAEMFDVLGGLAENSNPNVSFESHSAQEAFFIIINRASCRDAMSVVKDPHPIF
jgi:hypothetical protein